jgi:Predicted integral membrane protein (DUF2269)
MVTLYTVLLSIHILMAVIWLGGAFMTQINAVLAIRAARPPELVRFLHDTEAIGLRVFLPASLILVATGFGLIAEGNWDFELWIILALAVWVGSVITGAGFLGPESGRIGAIVEREGPESPAALARIKRIFLISRIELTLLLLLVIDMVVKPGA